MLDKHGDGSPGLFVALRSADTRHGPAPGCWPRPL